MGTTTKIEWTDATWNPILGCSRVSDGCRNCYAERIAGRFPNSSVYAGLTQIVNGHPVWTGTVKETKKLLEPLSWRRPKRVFVNSMSDLFHENVTDEQRDRIFAVMALCPQHTFQVLTKRPERMWKYLEDGEERAYAIGAAAGCMLDGRWIWREGKRHRARIERIVSLSLGLELDGETQASEALLPLPNVWLGVSVENQAVADERVPLLLQTPAAKRFVSCEPLLGPLRLDRICEEGEGYLNAVAAVVHCDGRGMKHITGIDWVICGGESGPGARPMHPDWARSLRDQCQAAGVPFFFKQWGEWWALNQMRGDGLVKFSAHGLVHDRWTSVHEGRDEPDPELGLRTYDLDGNDGAAAVYRVGKKVAASLLDGREWKEFPG